MRAFRGRDVQDGCGVGRWRCVRSSSPLKHNLAMNDEAVEADALLRSPGRLAAVQRSGLLDTPAEEAFDTLTRLGALLLKAPASFVSIVAEQRDFYKSQSGFAPDLASARQLTGRTFCHLTLGRDEPLVIGDTHANPSWKAVSTVDSLGVRAYVGVPLKLDGHNVGSFCVIDIEPRTWTAVELEVIEHLGLSAARELQLREAARRAAEEAEHMRELVLVKEKLVAVVAHDLRTPLQVFALGAASLKRGAGASAEQLAIAERLLTATAAMKQLVDELILEHTNLPGAGLRPQPVAASKLLRDVVDTMAPIAARAKISLLLGPLADDAVLVDYAQMLRVFSNLVGNAAKYCAAGSTVELSARRHGSAMLMIVVDDGCGFSDEHRARAFDSGWQGPEGLARGDGVGLGLAIVRSLTQGNGGEVTLESQRGKGARFTLRMPLA